jgi:hypothetical protein
MRLKDVSEPLNCALAVLAKTHTRNLATSWVERRYSLVLSCSTRGPSPDADVGKQESLLLNSFQTRMNLAVWSDCRTHMTVDIGPRVSPFLLMAAFHPSISSVKLFPLGGASFDHHSCTAVGQRPDARSAVIQSVDSTYHLRGMDLASNEVQWFLG